MSDIMQLARALINIEENILLKKGRIVSIRATNLGGEWDIIIESESLPDEIETETLIN